MTRKISSLFFAKILLTFAKIVLKKKNMERSFPAGRNKLPCRCPCGVACHYFGQYLGLQVFLAKYIVQRKQIV